jgi:hypothetical protein
MKHISVRLLISGLCLLSFAACSEGIKGSIRQHDFRTYRRAERAAKAPPPSPIANVADMPGWTTDLDGALAFARDNSQKTVVFIQGGNPAQDRSMKSALTASQMNSALARSQKVTFDAGSVPELAARYPAHPPAVLVLDPAGSVIAQQQGAINKTSLNAAVR